MPLVFTDNATERPDAAAHTGISMLHQDVLWEIFLWNANFFATDQALETTLRSSQVCRAWRTFLLSSTPLWGRLLDLDALDQKTDNWRKEILRRSGNSLLWIGGSIQRLSSDLRRSFLFSILDVHWGRVQHLRLILFNEPMEDRSWHFLQRPAPSLQSIMVYPFDFNRRPLFSASPIPLFDGYAPSLISFAVRDVHLHLHAPWLVHLRHLSLSSQFTALGILNALQSTPFLESLSISNLLAQRNLPGSMPTVNLPKLTAVLVEKSRLSVCISLLQHIQAADCCSLSCLAGLSSRDSRATKELKAASPTLSRLVRRYLRTHNVTELDLDIGARSFWIQDHVQIQDRKPTLKILLCSQKNFPPIFYDLLPSVFLNCDFSSISKMRLNLPPLSATSAIDYNPLFLSLTSLRDLHIENEHTLRTFLHLPVGACHIFPLLRTLQIGDFEQISPDPNGSGVILVFLLQRRDIGLPIHTLDLLMSRWDSHHIRNMRLLDEIRGLKVRYGCDHGKFK